MALDANLFTLVLTPAKGEPTVVDLVDPHGEVHYRKRFISSQPTYQMSIFDPHTDALLCTVAGTNPAAKQKTIELFNPNVTVSFQNTGTLSFKWSFTWEQHEFEWKKEACFLIRKPDPPVIVCSCDAPQTSKRSALQILDYNLQRFDIDDRKGLEICIIAGLLSFYDQQDESNRVRQPERRGPLPVVPSTAQPELRPHPSQESLDIKKDLPPPPPVPIPRDGNEIFIIDDVPVHDYVQQCAELLLDENILFIILRAQSTTAVPKCVTVAEEVKRWIYRSTDEDQELHQYVTTDEKVDGRGKGRGKHRINLDEPVNNPKHDYHPLGPPQTLTIHLSKIPMPELQPKAAPKPPTIPRAPPIAQYVPPSGAPPNLSPSEPRNRLTKADKGKGRTAELLPLPNTDRKSEKAKGKQRAESPPPDPAARVDKGKGRENPTPMLFSPNPSSFPAAESRPDKGKTRADDPPPARGRTHRPSPSVPQLRIDTSARPASAPTQPRPLSYQPNSVSQRPPANSQQYPLPPQPNRQGYDNPNSVSRYPQSGPQPYGIAPGPYAVYGTSSGAVKVAGQGAYLAPYPPGTQAQGTRPQSDSGGSMFDKIFRPRSR
ncbi:hypothetical protein DACRYDRAFT_105696 [Dacryopinax primogenitus]|uniref:Uncharacterized protein n=1 Tax=Dacryopinax primogenitus (strain DJM 731) TaxID=1858805 RepID=M5GES4_DACPD|nr:uncharacterized protein DACRYDRAFT_105696 [Dacryopinax primogenitus]EJU03538.1 hypothetical protein DACRYDRAFT_105696 [Dacryopinax primogenitus]